MFTFLDFHMRHLIAICLLGLITLQASASETLTRETAVKVAEKFVAENGYTNLPMSRLKNVLDNERIEWTSDHQQLVAQRFNTLSPVGIGVRPGRKNGDAGWSVAFDYTANPGAPTVCRVVTMASNGRNIRVEHADGLRAHFVGLKKQ
jgi:hypothetical protein